MFKKSKGLLAVLLALMLSLTMAPFAHAADPVLEEITTAAITKVLKVPVGTDVPDVDFTFTVTPVSVNNQTALVSTMPALGNAGVVTISFPGAYQREEFVAPDSDYYYLESAELLANIVWPDTGVYEYRIVENPTVITLGPGDFLIESQAVYRLRVHVRENDAKELYIWGVGAYRIVSDDGDDLGSAGEKVDPTPGGGSSGFDYSQMTFSNIYYKHNGGGGEDPEMDTLKITKTTGGAYGSSATYFDFTLTINKPSLVPNTETSYRAYILDGTTVVTALADNKVAAGLIGTDSLGVACINVPLGTAFTFALKSGQSLVFTNAFVGSNYAVSEAGAPDYMASATVISDATNKGTVTGTKGNGVAVPGGVITANPLVGEGANATNFTNTNNGDIETGITMENLPFIAMIALALVGLGAFIAVRARKRSAENQ